MQSLNSDNNITHNKIITILLFISKKNNNFYNNSNNNNNNIENSNKNHTNIINDNSLLSGPMGSIDLQSTLPNIQYHTAATAIQRYNVVIDSHKGIHFLLHNKDYYY